MVKAAKQGKAIFEKHGAEFLRLSRFQPPSSIGSISRFMVNSMVRDGR
jgi:hypothetical protein